MLILSKIISNINSSFYCTEEPVFLQNTLSLETAEVLPSVLLNLIKEIPKRFDSIFHCYNIACPDMIISMSLYC